MRHAALESEKDQVGAPANAEFAEQIGDVELHGALGNVELAGNFFVGEILEERIQDFLFAAAEIRDGIGFEAPALVGEDGIDKAGENGARYPEAAAGDKGKSADQLIACFDIGQKAFHAKTEKRKTIGFVVLFADDNQAGFGMALENVGEQRPSSGTCGMPIDNINLRSRRFEVAQVRRQGRLELFGCDLELGLRKNALKFA